MTKISVIMSAYNENQQQVDAAIQSILNQTLTDFEFLIVSDNPNNQALNQHLKAWAKRDQRIKFLPNEHNLGLAPSLNRGIKHAHSPWLARMDADDVSQPERFIKQLQIIQDRQLDVLSSNADFIDESGKIIGQHNWIPEESQQLAQLLPYGSDLIHPSVMMKTAAVKAVGGYRLLPTAEDYDLWLRLLKNGYHIGATNQKLFKYRIRTNSMTQSDRYKVFVVTQYLQKIYRQEQYPDSKTEIAELTALLNQKQVNDATINANFNQAVQNLSLGKTALKSGHLFKAINLILPALTNKDVRQYARTSQKFNQIYQSIKQQ